MRNKPFILLIAFTGLMGTVFSMAKTYTPHAQEWVTISLDDPPAPLPDPLEVTVAALSPISDLALVSSPIPEHLHVDY
jgi:hypothetical protein